MRTSTIAATLIAAASAAPAFATPTPRWVAEARAGAPPSLSSSVQTVAQIGTLSNAAVTLFRELFNIEKRELTSEEVDDIMFLLKSGSLNARAGAPPSLSSSVQTAAQIGTLSNAAVTLFRELFNIEKRELTPEDVADIMFTLKSGSLKARAGAPPSLSSSVQTVAQIGTLSNAAVTLFRELFNIEKRELTPEDVADIMFTLKSGSLKARAGAPPSLSSSVQTVAQIGTLSNAAVTLFRELFNIEKRELTPEDLADIMFTLKSGSLKARAGAPPSLSSSVQTVAQIGTLSNAAVTLFRELFNIEKRELTPEDLADIMFTLKSGSLKARAGAPPSLSSSVQTVAQIGTLSNAAVTLFRELFNIERRDLSAETLRTLLSGAPIAGLD